MTSSMTQNGWTVSVDGGPPVPADVTVTQEWEYVRSYSAVLPDPKWLFEDSHGHLHIWTVTGRDRRGAGLPSLVASQRHMPCDGSCGGVCGGEGFDITVYHCVDCGDEVEPGFIPDYAARNHGIPFEGMRSMSATLTAWPFGRKTPRVGVEWVPAVLVNPSGTEIQARVLCTEYEMTSGRKGPESAKVKMAIRPEVGAEVLG